VDAEAIRAEITRILALDTEQTRALWYSTFKNDAPSAFSRMLLCRMLVWRLKEKAYGGHDRATLKRLAAYAAGKRGEIPRFQQLKSGTVLVREYQGARHIVTIARDGYIFSQVGPIGHARSSRSGRGWRWSCRTLIGRKVDHRAPSPTRRGQSLKW
jgi:hypothetical protein